MKKIFHSKIAGIAAPKCIARRVSAGFVIIETLVSVALILWVLPGVLGMATKGVTLGNYAKNQMLALYLAEEGIEYIQARRDYNLLRIARGDAGPPAPRWDDGFTLSSDTCKTKACTINPLAPTLDAVIQKCSGTCKLDTTPPDPAYRLYVDANGFYSHVSTGQPTQFYRGVFVDGNPASLEHTITSVVVWQTGFTQKSISVTGYITDWFQ